ncbi:MAG: DUF1013 domain-containing protein [Rickettsiaceae bacterium]|nr:DUF1013 domain-containing protein [Rickettsiaceae bacterium]
MSKKQKYPLMQKATAVWLVDNTTLTFEQIANFCGLHKLEVQGIADGDVATGIMGVSPITSGQLEKEELERCTLDPKTQLTLKVSAAYESTTKNKKRANYTPIARRQDKPDAIYWLLKNFPNIADTTIIKLIGTTKTTIAAIRDRSHWNMTNIRQRDPVLLGICSQIDLDRAIEKIRLQDADNTTDETK